ncbi:MAG: Hcp family type VI secretion system effector [Ilumatobacteraceae bacterium]
MAERWFLKLDGIVGESMDVVHPGEIDVQSWSWGVSNSGSPGTGGGSGAGKASFEDFHFVTRISAASPPIFLACATGTHIKEARLSGSRDAVKGKTSDFLKYRLHDVTVTSIEQTDSDADPPGEHFSINYAKVEVSYTPQNPLGKMTAPVTAGFDLKANKKL